MWNPVYDMLPKGVASVAVESVEERRRFDAPASRNLNTRNRARALGSTKGRTVDYVCCRKCCGFGNVRAGRFGNVVGTGGVRRARGLPFCRRRVAIRKR